MFLFFLTLKHVLPQNRTNNELDLKVLLSNQMNRKEFEIFEKVSCLLLCASDNRKGPIIVFLYLSQSHSIDLTTLATWERLRVNICG